MRLIFGRAGTGKNRFVFDEIQATAKQNHQICIIVPEQTLFSIEKRLFLQLGSERFSYVSVLSFSAVANRILKSTGKANLLRLNDAAKVTLIRRAIGTLGDEISFYHNKKNQIEFHILVSSVIDECKEALTTPDRIEELSRNASVTSTAQKLHELAIIYRRYEELLTDRYEDDASRLSEASLVLAESGLLTNKTIYIDGFTGFSGPEYNLIKAMASVAKEVVVTLLGDKESSNNDVFEPVRKTEKRLREALGDYELQTIYIPTEKSFLAPGIAAIERFLLTGVSEKTDLEGIYLIKEKGPYDELTRVAAEIVDLVRNYNYRYSEIAIIARNIESYRSVVERTFRLYDIPYFPDWTRNESYSSTASFIRAALRLKEDPIAENMLALAKTSLTSLSTGDIAEFENYIYVWNLNRSRIQNTFANNPDGFQEGMTEQNKQRLHIAEQTRLTLLGWVNQFIDSSKDVAASEIIRQIYLLMINTGAITRLTEDKEARNAIDLLEQLYHILGDEYLEASEIISISEVLFGQTYIGRIPPMIEQVQVGAANRIRTNQPKVVFVLGLLEGVFPLTNFEFEMFSHKEREYMLENGVELINSFENLLQLEQLYFYNALTSASERVYLSIPKQSTSGDNLEPTGNITSFLEINDLPMALTTENRYSTIVNEATARAAYLTNSILASDIHRSGLFDFCDYLDSISKQPSYSLENMQLIGGVLPKQITLSPSSIETFMNCRFRYFLRYMARIIPIKPVEMSYITAGNYIHFVMEQIFQKTQGDLLSYDMNQIDSYCTQASLEFIDIYLSDVLDDSNQIRYQLSRLKAQAMRLVQYLRNEQQFTDFKPVDFELSITKDGKIIPRELTTDDGTSISVVGKVDRVDVAEIDSKRYIRVVDYKTGVKAFSLDDVAYGLNMQMLIYLFSVTDNVSNPYGKTIPAGVLYIPSDPPIRNIEEGIDRVREAYRMDGMLLKEDDVLEAMEHTGEGVYIPALKKGDGYSIPADKKASSQEMDMIKTHIDRLIIGMVEDLKSGNISAIPTIKNKKSPCDYCDYTSVCRNDRIDEYKEIVKGAHSIFTGGNEDD